MRYFVQLSYFGKNYHGWQVQPNAPSVQETLNKAMTLVFDEPVHLVGAGRTDTGVHARQMWAHFDVEKEIPENALHRLNGFLPHDIALQAFVKVSGTAHARFDAVSRAYQYHLYRHKDPFAHEYGWQVHAPLDLALMGEATEYLFRYSDFSCFSKSRTQTKTNLCEVKEAFWEVEGERLVFHITADRFLRNMVRAIVGTLVEIGTGKRPVEDMARVIESKNRGEAGESAPARGLYLTEVKYPKQILNGE